MTSWQCNHSFKDPRIYLRKQKCPQTPYGPLFAVALKIYLQLLPRVTNVCCLLLSGCFDPSSFLSEAQTSSARRYFWKLKRTFLQFGKKEQHSPLGPSHCGYQSGRIFEKYPCRGFSGIQRQAIISGKHRHLDPAYQKRELKGN